MSTYNVGDIINCTVTGIEEYGFFVKADDNYIGLVHISEISDEYVRKVNYYVKQGEHIFAKVIDVDNRKKKLILSIKDIRYKEKENFYEIVETRSGFSTLEKNLNYWMTKTMERLEEEKTKL